jgi:glycosyl transferase family 87
MWFYVNHILVPYQRSDAAAHGRPRGNLSDLYPRWLGARELLLHGRNPYSPEVTREIQVGYYGRELDGNRPGDPKDQQGFVYPAYVAFLLAPTVQLPFEQVRVGFGWMLIMLTAVSVLLWLRVVGWWPHTSDVVMIMLLTLGSFPAIQGFKLQQLSLVVTALIAAASALLVRGQLVAAGVVLALATIKPQLVLPMVLWLLLWTASDWQQRQRFVWGFGATMALLLGGSEILLPGWFGNFLTAAREYRGYAGGMSMLDVLLSRGWGRSAAGLLVAVVALVCWRFRRERWDAPYFALMIALVLVVTVIVIPMFAPYNYLLVLPTLLLLARDWPPLWSEGAVARTGLLVTAGVVAWSWVAALGLAVGSVMLPAATVQKRWWLPLYTSAKVPIPLVCLMPLSVLVVSAWRKMRSRVPAPQPVP